VHKHAVRGHPSPGDISINTSSAWRGSVVEAAAGGVESAADLYLRSAFPRNADAPKLLAASPHRGAGLQLRRRSAASTGRCATNTTLRFFISRVC
jgi:hypothetical protein